LLQRYNLVLEIKQDSEKISINKTWQLKSLVSMRI